MDNDIDCLEISNGSVAYEKGILLPPLPPSHRYANCYI